MLNLFTPEYIELAKNSRVQELRPELKLCDKVCIGDIKDSDVYAVIFASNRYGGEYYRIVKSEKDKFYRSGFREKYFWLPTGDALDQEIVKICDEKKNWAYKILYIKVLTKEYNAEIIDYSTFDKEINNFWVVYSFNNSNPLIARISLLIKLLEGE
jgi:hypothetical protein